MTYTSWDMQPFAREMGPTRIHLFPGTVKDELRHSRARPDALYFLLYGIGREDADDILGTFPIVRAADQAAFGRFVTRDLVLGDMRASEAGDIEVRINIR